MSRRGGGAATGSAGAARNSSLGRPRVSAAGGAGAGAGRRAGRAARRWGGGAGTGRGGVVIMLVGAITGCARTGVRGAGGGRWGARAEASAQPAARTVPTR